MALICSSILLIPAGLFAQAFDETEYSNLSQQFMKYYNAAQYREAEPVARRLLDIAPRLYPGKPLPQGKALQNLGEILLRLGKLAEAETVAAQGIAQFQQVGEPGKLALADGYDLLGRIQTAAGKFPSAERSLKQGLAIREETWGPLHDHVGKSQLNLGALYVANGNVVEAEKSLKSALSIFERMLGPQHFSVADAATNLGNLFEDLGRTREAEAQHLRALSIYEKVYGEETWPASQSLQNLANACKNQGRFAEAESLSRRALAILQKTLPPGHPSIGDLVNNLGNIADDQGRTAEAEKLYEAALANYRQAYGPDHLRTALALNNLALALQGQSQHVEAEKLLRQAYDIRASRLGNNHPDTLATLSNIGSSQWHQGRFDDALKTDEQLLEQRQKVLGPRHPDVIASLRNLAVTLRSLKNLPRAEELLSQAITLAVAQVVQPRDLAMLYDLRARTRHEQHRPAEALQDLKEAVLQSEQQRRTASGGETERATAFAQEGDIFERLVTWSIQQHDLAGAWDAVERSRARTLLDQLELSGADLLAGVGWRAARPLRKRDADARLRVTELERSLQQLTSAASPAGGPENPQRQKLEADLRAARQEVLAAYRDIRNASPAYRLMLSQKFQPAELTAVDTWLQQVGGVMLRYYVSSNSSWVFVIRPGKAPEVFPLTHTGPAATADANTSQNVTHEFLRQTLLGTSNPGLLSKMSDPASAEDAIDDLHRLWKILIPQPVQTELLSGSVRHLVVVPDGPLAMLPFDALVVESHADSQQVKYLLDRGPPILSAPSATILLNLAGRESSAENRGVLTLGDAVYGGSTVTQLRGSPAARYHALGGKFSPLPHSAVESRDVATLFESADPPVKLLQQQSATEAAVRKEVAKKRVVHLACHGFCDDADHNFFGALVVTPGPAADGPTNDGYLTVAEMVELPLVGCELSILSACETNLGPQQQGEAAWALSRGFLAAGTRRVIASDWLVDDKAAATLIADLCGRLAEAQSKSQPLDVATKLHAAKRAIRAQPKWDNPHYWATFVLVGPP